MPLSEAARRVAELGRIQLSNADLLSARPVSFDFKELHARSALEILVQDDGKTLLIDGDRARIVANADPHATSTTPAATGRAASIDVRTQRPPRYPASAVANKQSGVVVVIVDVTPEGRVAQARIEKWTTAGGFDKATLDAVKQWTFEPAIRDGKPIAGRVRVPVRYDMDEDNAPEPVSASAA